LLTTSDTAYGSRRSPGRRWSLRDVGALAGIEKTAYPFVKEEKYQRLFWRYQQEYQQSPVRAHNLKATMKASIPLSAQPWRTASPR
jgi:hypothetical protein